MAKFTNYILANFLLNLLPWVTAEKSTQKGKFLVFTDFHINDRYDQKGDPDKMCMIFKKQNNGTEKNRTPKENGPGLFGAHSCDPPLALVEFMLGEAKKQLPDPDYIIWTGDSAAHDTYNENRLIQTLAKANGAIRKHFPDAVVVPVLGNHESVPGNDFPDTDNSTDYAAIFEGWKGWIGESAKDTFYRGGYYRFDSPSDNSSFIVLNTNIYYVLNKEINNFTNPLDPTGQFAFLEAQLEEIKNKNSFAHILAHVPIGAYEQYSFNDNWHPEMPQLYNERLLKLFVDYAPWIRWMIFGHLHTDTFRILKDSNGKPVQRIFLNPSVSPVFNLNNPAFRIYEYNTSNMDIEDIKTYYVELDELNRLGAQKTEAKLEYSMRKTYEIQAPLGAETLSELLEKLKNDENLFNEYYNRSTVMWNYKELDPRERNTHLCVMEYVDHERLKMCLQNVVNGAPSLKFSFFTLAILLVAIMVPIKSANF